MCTAFVAAYVLPEVAADQSRVRQRRPSPSTPPRHRHRRHRRCCGTVIQVTGFAYLVGGLLFGIALFRARVLPRWAAALLAVGGIVTAALVVMPDAFYRFLAFPNGIAMIALGYSLWQVARTRRDPDDADAVRTACSAPAGVA